MTILYGVFTQGDFFQRNDSFCWIRPDYLIGAVIIPLTILSINAILTIFIMSLRLFPHFKISKLIRTSSTKINKISNKEARERAFVLFLVQFTLGVPWLLQYFTLFEPKATAWHFLFVIVNGSQGIIILISFIYRCYGTYKSYHLQKRLWT
uniref:G-protein coupled receptors family 2 profile 2 domain-containing protein n=1 Tax=Panagrolaimus davidi TaxID=227884 RepID=A0A914PT52_9BILA